MYGVDAACHPFDRFLTGLHGATPPTHKYSVDCLPIVALYTQSRVQRDYITREQLGAIFQARADMMRAVDELASVFNTGRLLRQVGTRNMCVCQRRNDRDASVPVACWLSKLLACRPRSSPVS